MCICVWHVYVSESDCSGQERAVDLLEYRQLGAMDIDIETELWSFGREASSVNYQAISPAPGLQILVKNAPATWGVVCHDVL